MFNALHKSCKKLKFKSFLIRFDFSVQDFQPQSKSDVKKHLIKYCANTYILANFILLKRNVYTINRN